MGAVDRAPEFSVVPSVFRIDHYSTTADYCAIILFVNHEFSGAYAIPHIAPNSSNVVYNKQSVPGGQIGYLLAGHVQDIPIACSRQRDCPASRYPICPCDILPWERCGRGSYIIASPKKNPCRHRRHGLLLTNRCFLFIVSQMLLFAIQ